MRRHSDILRGAVSVLLALALLAAVVLVLPGDPPPEPAAPPGAPAPPVPVPVWDLFANRGPLPAVDTGAANAPGLGTAARARLTARLDAQLAGQGRRLSVCVQDLRTGTAYGYGAHDQYPTASVVKLTLLVVLLLQAQEEGRELNAQERAGAEEMIRHSDNAVTNGFYAGIGFNDGLLHGAELLGMPRTQPDDRGVWGATRTTAADQVRLLRAVYTDDSPLTEDNRAYVRELMESVAPEQAWGASAAAEDGDTVGVKNGWVPLDSDGGRWVVNSTGYVTGPGREYLVSVLSEHQPDYVSGVESVEHAVAAVAEALEGGAVAPPSPVPSAPPKAAPEWC